MSTGFRLPHVGHAKSPMQSPAQGGAGERSVGTNGASTTRSSAKAKLQRSATLVGMIAGMNSAKGRRASVYREPATVFTPKGGQTGSVIGSPSPLPAIPSPGPAVPAEAVAAESGATPASGSDVNADSLRTMYEARIVEMEKQRRREGESYRTQIESLTGQVRSLETRLRTVYHILNDDDVQEDPQGAVTKALAVFHSLEPPKQVVQRQVQADIITGGLSQKTRETVRSYFSDTSPSAFMWNGMPVRKTLGEQFVMMRSNMALELKGLLDAWAGQAASADALNFCTSLQTQLCHQMGMFEADRLLEAAPTFSLQQKLDFLVGFLNHVGWASLRIVQDQSVITPDGSFALTVHMNNSMESTAHQVAGVVAQWPCCFMTTGFIAGWCERCVPGVKIEAMETRCRVCPRSLADTVSMDVPDACQIMVGPRLHIEDSFTSFASPMSISRERTPFSTGDAPSQGRLQGSASLLELPPKLSAPSVRDVWERPRFFDELKRLRSLENEVGDLRRAKELLAQENEAANNLLHNMLPKRAAESLKKGHTLYGERFDNTTILFSDMVGFTVLAGKLTPGELVGVLNNLYSTFDRLCDVHNVYKLETVGDAYMVVAGCPEPQDDHADRAAAMALDMLKEIRKASFTDRHGNVHRLQIRIGMHSGPVIGGVVGHLMPRFHLFGDAVVLGSRMESSGVIGQIQCSAETYELLHERWIFEKRGEINVKGKGIRVTYMLLDRAKASRSSVAGLPPPKGS